MTLVLMLLCCLCDFVAHATLLRMLLYCACDFVVYTVGVYTVGVILTLI